MTQHSDWCDYEPDAGVCAARTARLTSPNGAEPRRPDAECSEADARPADALKLAYDGHRHPRPDGRAGASAVDLRVHSNSRTTSATASPAPKLPPPMSAEEPAAGVGLLDGENNRRLWIERRSAGAAGRLRDHSRSYEFRGEFRWTPASSAAPMNRTREPCRRRADYSSARRRSAANESGPPDAPRRAVHARAMRTCQ